MFLKDFDFNFLKDERKKVNDIFDDLIEIKMNHINENKAVSKKNNNDNELCSICMEKQKDILFFPVFFIFYF